jgi:hypothetical protein
MRPEERASRHLPFAPTQDIPIGKGLRDLNNFWQGDITASAATSSTMTYIQGEGCSQRTLFRVLVGDRAASYLFRLERLPARSSCS